MDLAHGVGIGDREALIAQLAEIEAIYSSAHVGLCVLDTDLRYRRINQRLAEINGIAPADHIGKTVREIVPTLADEVEQIAKRIFETGEPVIDLEISGETASQPGVLRHWIEQWLALRNSAGEIVGVNVAVEEVTARRNAEAALRDREHLLSVMFNSLPVAVAQIDNHGKVILANAEMQRYMPNGLLPSQSTSELQRWRAQHPDGTPFRPEEFPGSRALRGERVVPGIDMLYTDLDGCQVWTNTSCVPVLDEYGRINGIFAIIADITHRKKAEERERLLKREVDHRAKNMLNIVQAIARFTAADTQQEFLDRFADRIEALSASQSLLVGSGWTKVPLNSLVRSQLGHFADLIDRRIRLTGPPVEVAASAAQGIGMAIHELATNAAKHGALANESGHVAVCWSLSGDGPENYFTLSWTESGGPPVSQPKARGFGSIVTGRMLKADLEGEVEANFAPRGLVWKLTCPAAKVVEGLAPG